MTLLITGSMFGPHGNGKLPKNDFAGVANPDAVLENKIEGVKQIIWLFHAPWFELEYVSFGLKEGGDGEMQASLARWLKLHRTLLRKRRQLDGELRIVNLEKIDVPIFLKANGLQDMDMDVFKVKEGQNEYRAWRSILREQFATLFPEYWDMFEILEALSENPHQKPNDEHLSMEPAELLSLYDHLRAAKEAPFLKKEFGRLKADLMDRDRGLKELAELTQSVQETADANLLVLQHELKDATSHQSRLQKENDELLKKVQKSEQQAIEAQSHGQKTLVSLQKELDQSNASREALNQQLEIFKNISGNDIAKAANAYEALNQKMLGTQAALQKEIMNFKEKETEIENSAKTSQKLWAETQEENEHLLLQLHQMQEELERYLIQGKAVEEVLDGAETTLNRARILIAADISQKTSTELFI